MRTAREDGVDDGDADLFPRRVFADYKGFTVETDGGRRRSAPAPFDLFMASGYPGIYARSCSGILSEGRDPMRSHVDPQTGMVGKIDIDLYLPESFPEKYRNAIVNAVNLCAVKRHLHNPPDFEVVTHIGETADS